MMCEGPKKGKRGVSSEHPFIHPVNRLEMKEETPMKHTCMLFE